MFVGKFVRVCAFKVDRALVSQAKWVGGGDMVGTDESFFVKVLRTSLKGESGSRRIGKVLLFLMMIRTSASRQETRTRDRTSNIEMKVGCVINVTSAKTRSRPKGANQRSRCRARLLKALFCPL